MPVERASDTMFVNGLMLLGLAAAAVPLVLHLLARARYRTVDWGAMMFLRGADARQRQNTRFNQVLLVLVRMAVVGLLAVALARPVVHGAWFGQAQSGHVTAAIVLDCSASMSFDENGRSRFELARGAARQVLAGLRRGDRALLLAPGLDATGPQQDLRPTPELRALDARLATIQPGHGSAQLFAAMTRAWDRLVEHEPLHRQIFVITDRQASAWRDATAAAAGVRAPWLNQPADDPATSEVFVVAVGGAEADNLVVESVELTDPPAVRGQPIDIDVRLRNYGSVQRASLPLVLRSGDRTIHEAKVNLAPGASSSFRASIKEGFPSAGSQLISASVTSSGFAADDRLDTVVEVIEPVRVLVLSGDERMPTTAPTTQPMPAGAGVRRGEADFLRVALAPYQAAGGQDGRDPCAVDVRPIEQWQEFPIGAYDVVILANIERFDERQARELEQFVYGGGGLLIAPGNLSRVENYNEWLYRNGAGLMPAELLPATPADGSHATALLGWRPEHPVFRFLRGRPDPLPSSTIGRYFPAHPRQPDARPLAEYVSGWPLLVESPRAADERRGRVILITTPLDADWGNLPFSNFYLPFVQSLARYLCGGPTDDRNLAPGEPIELKLDASPSARSATIQRPQDKAPMPLELLRYGDQAEARYADTRQPGVYRVVVNEEGKPPRTVHYVGTAPRDESDLTQIGEEQWRSLEESLGFELIDATDEPIASVMSSSRDGRELWSALVCAVIVLAVLELAMARAFSRAPVEQT